MRDEQLTVHEPDVGLNGGEAVLERVEQRAVVLVVVVGVRLRQRGAQLDVDGRAVACHGGRGEEGEGEHGGDGRAESAVGGLRAETHGSRRSPGLRGHSPAFG